MDYFIPCSEEMVHMYVRIHTDLAKLVSYSRQRSKVLQLADSDMLVSSN